MVAATSASGDILPNGKYDLLKEENYRGLTCRRGVEDRVRLAESSVHLSLETAYCKTRCQPLLVGSVKRIYFCPPFYETKVEARSQEFYNRKYFTADGYIGSCIKIPFCPFHDYLLTVISINNLTTILPSDEHLP